jgi:hypothetical protein
MLLYNLKYDFIATWAKQFEEFNQNNSSIKRKMIPKREELVKLLRSKYKIDEKKIANLVKELTSSCSINENNKSSSKKKNKKFKELIVVSDCFSDDDEEEAEEDDECSNVKRKPERLAKFLMFCSKFTLFILVILFMLVYVAFKFLLKKMNNNKILSIFFASFSTFLYLNW